MAKLSANNVGERICKALGLDPKMVASIDMAFHPGEVALMTVKIFVDEATLKKFDNDEAADPGWPANERG